MKEFLEYLRSTYPSHVANAEIVNGEMILWTDHTHIVSLMEFLRDNTHTQCKQLVEIAGVDYPEREKRFEVVYILLSLKHNFRLRVKLVTAENEPVPSVAGVFSSAGWFEREAWDMYGILFSGNPDLRRILTDYGFDGHPQRKDFPLTGYVEMRYDDTQKRVVYEPVKLNQAYRNFDYLSPWEGPAYPETKVVLPGDEKATGTK